MGRSNPIFGLTHAGKSSSSKSGGGGGRGGGNNTRFTGKRTGGRGGAANQGNSGDRILQREDDGTAAAEKFEEIKVSDEIDESLGFWRFESNKAAGEEKEGWLVNMSQVSWRYPRRKKETSVFLNFEPFVPFPSPIRIWLTDLANFSPVSNLSLLSISFRSYFRARRPFSNPIPTQVVSPPSTTTLFKMMVPLSNQLSPLSPTSSSPSVLSQKQQSKNTSLNATRVS